MGDTSGSTRATTADEPPAPLGWRDVVALGVLLAVSCAFQFSVGCIIGSDGFFHIRMAERVLSNQMPWMPLSVFGDGWIDHQLLFHLALAPFAWVLPGVTAAKLGAAVGAAFAGWACYRFVRLRGGPLPLLFALLPFALSWTFWARMEMPRAQSLSLVLLVASLGAMLAGRHWLVFALAWLYAWTYHVSVILLPISLLHLAMVAAASGELPAARRWKVPCLAMAGLASGFVIHPHSPRTLTFLYQHVVVKVLNRRELPVGPEWVEGGVVTLLKAGWGGLAALALAVVFQAVARRRRVDTLFITAVALFASLGAVTAVKFVEYSVPLSCLALALAARDLLASRGVALGRRRALRIALAIVVAGGVLWSGLGLRWRSLEQFPDPTRVEPAMAWITQHVPPGEIVYHFSWSHFSELVFYGPDYRYIVGLDPHFLALEDPELWTLYEHIGEGWGTNPSKPIRESFGAEWAVLVLPYPGAPEVLGNDPGMTVVFQDDGAIVYRVSP